MPFRLSCTICPEDRLEVEIVQPYGGCALVVGRLDAVPEAETGGRPRRIRLQRPPDGAAGDLVTHLTAMPDISSWPRWRHAPQPSGDLAEPRRPVARPGLRDLTVVNVAVGGDRGPP